MISFLPPSPQLHFDYVIPFRGFFSFFVNLTIELIMENDDIPKNDNKG